VAERSRLVLVAIVLAFDRGDREIGPNSNVKAIAGLCSRSANPTAPRAGGGLLPRPAEGTPPQATGVFYESADDSC
jgi:hypothetical protein